MKVQFILAMFLLAIIATCVNSTEQKPAHLGEDKFSNPKAWSIVVKSSGYKFDESQFQNRCFSDWNCAGNRRCSYWGWCN